MKKMNFLLLFICMSLPVLSQTEAVFSFGEFTSDKTVYLYGDKVNVRSTPSTAGTVVVNLPAGTELTIIEKADETMALGGYSTNWYKVSFMDKGSLKKGYVWGGLISMSTAALPSSSLIPDLFVWSISSYSPQNGFKATARVIRDGKIISSLEFDPITSGFFGPGEFGHSVSNVLDEGHKFKGVKNVIRLNFNYPACGYENGEIFIFWDGLKLTYAAKASSVVEASVFYLTYDLVFPDAEEDASPNTLKIYKTFEQVLAEPGDALSPEFTDIAIELEDGTRISRDITLSKYIWDGTKMTETPEEIIKNP